MSVIKEAKLISPCRRLFSRGEEAIKVASAQPPLRDALWDNIN